MRSFIATEIDSAILDKLGSIRDRGWITGKSVRWVRSQGIHLTYKFLGEIDPSEVTLVTEAMENATQGIKPFPLQVGRLGFFPNARQPRVFWAGAEDRGGELETVHAQLDRELERLVGLEREERSFKPHLTLARFRGRAGIAEDLKQGSEEIFGSQIVKEIILVKSELRPQGPLYTPMSVVTLKE
jgi:2'-5' RNA ligase